MKWKLIIPSCAMMLAVIGCQNTPTETENKSALDLEKPKAAAMALAKISSQNADQHFDRSFLAHLEKSGVCKGYIDFVEGFVELMEEPQQISSVNDLPQKIKRPLECIVGGPLSAQSFESDAFEKVSGADALQIIDKCICNGSGSIFGIFAHQVYSGYSAPESAAGEGYSAPGSTAGEGYSAPGSTAGEGYSAPSSAAGEGYAPPSL